MSLATIGTIAAIGPFIEYLRPSRSPYLLMVIFGTISLILTANFFQEHKEWLMLAMPQFLALMIFTAYAYYGKNEGIEDNQEEQLRFSRAFSIISALMCLALGAKQVIGKDILFNLRGVDT
ncbi:MAG: hypothetical protein L3J28_13335 [Candidatus Polarisedimenticolaceae bacterium]|nr:hypothetical protein [Candidatus Polarisedimenticolaceae bacterium]